MSATRTPHFYCLVTIALLGATSAVLYVTRDGPAPRPRQRTVVVENWSVMDLMFWLQGQGQTWRAVPSGRGGPGRCVFLFADLPAGLTPEQSDEVTSRAARMADATTPGEPPSLWRGVVMVEIHPSAEAAGDAAQDGHRRAWHKLTFSGDDQHVGRILEVLP